MARKKVTPLKDEEFGMSDELLAALHGVKASIDAWDRKFESMTPSSGFEQALRAEIARVVREKLDERLGALLKSQTKVMHKGKLASVDELVSFVIDKHERSWELAIAACGTVGDLHKLVDSNNSSLKALNENMGILNGKMDRVNGFLMKIPGVRLKKPGLPKFPAGYKQLPRYFFHELPKYWCQRSVLVLSSKHVRAVVRVSVINVIVILVELLCFIAYDNAQLRNTRAKYLMLRHVSRSNPEWSDAADYIEMLYSDKEAHKKEIERWRNGM